MKRDHAIRAQPFTTRWGSRLWEPERSGDSRRQTGEANAAPGPTLWRVEGARSRVPATQFTRGESQSLVLSLRAKRSVMPLAAETSSALHTGSAPPGAKTPALLQSARTQPRPTWFLGASGPGVPPGLSPAIPV